MPAERTALLLGCGDTSRRVARRLVAEGVPVIATTRAPDRLVPLAAAGATILAVRIGGDGRIEGAQALAEATRGRRLSVVHSMPPIETAAGFEEVTAPLLQPLARQIDRVIYISSTGVYGEQTRVDADTPVAPRTARQAARVAAESAVLALGAETLILRPAAIYGPGRGVLTRMREGTYRLQGGTQVGSRIHIDDLALHIHAAFHAGVTGTFPVADAEPATASDVAALAARLLGTSMPTPVSGGAASESAHVPRAVNGIAIRTALGIHLKYPTFRTGYRR